MKSASVCSAFLVLLKGFSSSWSSHAFESLFFKLRSRLPSDEQEALNSIMQDLAELHRSSRPSMFLSDLGKPKASSPKNQVNCLLGAGQEGSRGT